MNQTIGHLIRFSGLAIEMVGVWGVYNSIGSKNQGQLPVPGGTTVHWGWVVWALGFVVWLTGRLMVFASSKTLRCARKEDDESV